MACLSDTPFNLISYSTNAPHVGLHVDRKDGPLNLIAWTHTQDTMEKGTTQFFGGAFVLPSLRVMFTPAATSHLTIVLVATATLTHGTLPLRRKGPGVRIGTSHFLRCEDVEVAAARRPAPAVPHADEEDEEPFRPVMKHYMEALRAHSSRPAVDMFVPWLPYTAKHLRNK